MCVMKMKKLTTFVACAAMAGVFATSAFAANDAQVARAQDYLNSKGIAYTVTASDVDKALAAGYTADSLVAKANELLDRAKSDPEGAKNEAVSILNALGVSVSDAKVTIEINGTHTKTFTTSNIACKGVTSGYRANIDTKEIEVTLRALSQDALNRIKPEDITVVADLSDYGTTTGQIIVSAKVTVSGHENVGAVGEVKVTVTIYKD